MGSGTDGACERCGSQRHYTQDCPEPEGIDFGTALKMLKAGERVLRRGWNGKGMWLALVTGDDWKLNFRGPPWLKGCGDLGHTMLPWIAMRTVQGGLVPWLASQTDILAEDWIAHVDQGRP